MPKTNNFIWMACLQFHWFAVVALQGCDLVVTKVAPCSGGLGFDSWKLQTISLSAGLKFARCQRKWGRTFSFTMSRTRSETSFVLTALLPVWQHQCWRAWVILRKLGWEWRLEISSVRSIVGSNALSLNWRYKWSLRFRYKSVRQIFIVLVI